MLCAYTEDGVAHPTQTSINTHVLAYYMAKSDSKVRMPSSMGGLTQYFEGEESKIMLTPKQTMIAIGAVATMVVILHVIA